MVDLQSFGGYATFTNTAQPGWTDHTERFLACDGVTLFIFSVADDWKLLYRINVSPKPDHGISKYLTDTTAGGLFILKESPYEISVWSIASGTALHHVQSKFKVSKYYIASDGATFGISTEQVMFLYSTLTGELVQTVSIPALGKAGFLEGASQLISRRFRDGMINFSIQSTSNTKLRKMILAPPWGKATLKDVWPVWKDPKVDGPSALVAMDHGSFLDVSFVQDMVMRDDGSRLRSCGPHCASRVLPLPHFTESCTNAFIDGSATYDLKISGEDGDRFQRLNISIRYNDGKLKRLHLVARRFYFLPKHHRVVSVDREKKGSLHYSIYNLPKMQLEELELSLYWELAASGESYEVLACSHERNLTTRINDTRLSVGKVCAPENMAYFFAPFERLVQQHWQALAENNPERAHAIIRYLRTHINYYSSPGDHSQSVITAICKVWHTGRHESYRAFLYQLLRHDLENQWEPRAKYSIGSNPVAIMLEKAKRNPKALDAVHIIIGQNIERARREQDVTCIQYLCECLDDLVARHREVALRVTRGFAFIKCNDRRFVISHHKIIHPPTLHRLWSVENQRIYQIRNPILQLDYRRQKDNPLNETFTEDIFVAPMNLLWTFVPDKYNSCQEYCRVNTKPKITWATALVHMAVLNFAPTSHVYIRTRFYRLEVLDNPAVVALVQYKWNTFAYALWVARFTTQCVFYVLILIAASMQIYYPKPDSLLGVFVAIVAFSCFFLWLEFLQWRESKYYTSIGYEEDMLSSGKDDSEMDKETAAQVILERGIAKSGGDDGGVPKKTPTQPQRADVQASASMSTLTSAKDTEHGKGSLKYSRERSPYFRSPYNILDLAMYLVPLATSVHQIVNIAQSGTDGVIWDFSFCVVLVLLHLLAELRVSETVCKYITIVIDAIREIRVFFVVLGGVVLCFSLAILHVLHGVGGDLWPRPNVNLPSNYIGAVTTVYLMMGGRYDPLEDDLSGGSDSGGTPGYKHWPLLVMVMIYFFFSSILMLNVLIALINVAFNKVDDSWRQVWLENRLRYVESAENISYHIPGNSLDYSAPADSFRETFDWFPSQIYYTANPYQVKQYWRRVNRKDEEILMEDEIQEFSLKPTPTSDAGDILMMDPVEDWATSEAVSTSPLLVSKIDEIQKAVSTKSEDDRSLLHEHFKEHGAGIQQQLEKYSREMEGRFEQQDQAVQEQRMQVTRLWSGSENVQRDVDQLREAVERTQEDIAEIKQDLRTLLAALLPAPKEE
ncbi:hypothetical protein BGW38_003039 [Lunasporangiospora selenospora]|uniref:Ion transport domain-containing protein n=1 Tax=Lunasporangiospora selenospora TaxID=979761 RepID=A0A9P6FRZ5_9FUNG|nr:hypothetical protein BGW38_003039 [Lunasporangiospora selenospora]